jgi:cholesterol transport system auxiliary component
MIQTGSIAWTLVRVGLTAVLGATLLGCGFSERPALVRQTYLLQAKPPTQPLTTAPRAASLKLSRFVVAAAFGSTALSYRQTDARYVSDFYFEYFVAPAPMLTDAATVWLAAAGIFRDVFPPSASPEGDFLLEGFVSELYGDFRDESHPAATITAKFFLSDNRSTTGIPIWQREYTQRVALRDRAPEAVATGLSAAWTAMLADLGRDLAALKLPK